MKTNSLLFKQWLGVTLGSILLLGTSFLVYYLLFSFIEWLGNPHGQYSFVAILRVGYGILWMILCICLYFTKVPDWVKACFLTAGMTTFLIAISEDISTGGNIRNATFTAIHSLHDADIDVKTITLYDDNLANTNAFTNIYRTREQRSGFYINHPGILRAGIGITRNYGGIWTPAYLNRNELLSLSLRVMTKLERQLTRVAEEDEREHISYFSNVEVYKNAKKLTGRPRKLIGELLINIVVANREPGRSISLPHDLLMDLIKYRNDSQIAIASCNSYEFSDGLR